MHTDSYRHDLITICIPAYNEELFLRRAITSIKRQSWNDFVVVISDNASTDSTGDIAREVAAADHRFHYFRHEQNIGSARNIQFLLDITSSEFIVIMGAHDCLAPAFLNQHLKAMRSNSICSLSYSATQWIDEDDKVLRISRPYLLSRLPSKSFPRYLMAIACMSECTAINQFIRRNCLKSDVIQPIVGTDVVMLLHLIYTGPFNYEPDPLYIRRAFRSRNSGMMERITGKPVAHADFSLLIKACLSDITELTKTRRFSYSKRLITKALLTLRFAIYQRNRRR